MFRATNSAPATPFTLVAFKPATSTVPAVTPFNAKFVGQIVARDKQRRSHRAGHDVAGEIQAAFERFAPRAKSGCG